MASTNRWRPILEGNLADRCRGAIEDILDELRKPEQAPMYLDLAGGQSGMALFWHYMGLARKDDELSQRAEEALEKASERVSEGVHNASFFSGFTGVAWVFQHTQGPQEEEDQLGDIDDALMTYLEQDPWVDDYDLIIGLVGIGVYALERMPAQGGKAILERILDRLDSLKVTRPEGFTWMTPPHLLPEWQREINPDGYYNLGLAHGVPGVIALLGRMHQAGIQPDRTMRLLEGAMSWFLAQRNPEIFRSSFRAWASVSPKAEPEYEESRIAWCYGELGASAALLLAARAVGRLDFEKVALEVARRAAACPMDLARCVDAGLCHGAAGNALIFNRIYQATGEEVFREAALRWYERVFETRAKGRGVAGFGAYRPPKAGEAGEGTWEIGALLLEGAAGIALVLQAGLGGPAPDWDTMLMTNIAPKGGQR